MRPRLGVLALALIALGVVTAGLPALHWRENLPPPVFGDATPPGAVASDEGRTPAVTQPAAALTHVADTSTAAAPAGRAVAAAPEARRPSIAVPMSKASHDARIERVAGPRPIPVAVRVASLDIDAPVVPATVEAGELLIPDDPTTAAWYQGGPAPGEAGSAVVAAHVDFGGRLGAFHRLQDAQPGDVVDVAFDDGSTDSFRVVALTRIPRDALPTAELFSPVGEPILTLITCGGEFDRSTHHYSDNVVLRAVPAAPAP